MHKKKHTSEKVRDYINIHDLSVDSIIGCHVWERSQPQPLIFNLSLGVNFCAAFNEDCLKKTVDYVDVANGIKVLCKKNKFFLLERLMKEVMLYLFSTWPIYDAHVFIRKPQALHHALVEIESYRTYEEIEQIMSHDSIQ